MANPWVTETNYDWLFRSDRSDHDCPGTYKCTVCNSRALGREIRYGTFSQSVERRKWVACRSAAIDGETLKIVYPDGMVEWVPLHYIRGPIQYREKQAEAER